MGCSCQIYFERLDLLKVKKSTREGKCRKNCEVYVFETKKGSFTCEKKIRIIE